tara:strand:- start:147998 stop:148828 length:831 start_codon:yes stop_codon:yes gene_type:complete
MENPVNFDPVKHRYYVEDVDGEIEYISVSNYINTLKTPFDRTGVLDRIMIAARDKPGHKYHMKSKSDILTEWEENGKLASARGTLLHFCIETYLKEEALGEKPNCFPVAVQESQDTDSDLVAYWRGFVNFRAAYPWKLTFSERILASSEYKIAGTPDVLFEDPDHPGYHILVDWKSTKPLKKEVTRYTKYFTHWAVMNLPDTNYWSYCLQLSLYSMMLKEQGYKISRACVVRFGHGTGNSLYEITEMDFLDANIKNLLCSRKLEIKIYNQKNEDNE